MLSGKVADLCPPRFLVDGRKEVPVGLLPELRANLEAWNSSHLLQDQGCFWQSDTADGGEDSISGDGCRPSINAVMVLISNCYLSIIFVLPHLAS